MDNLDSNFKNLIATHFQNERIENDNGWSFMESKLRKQNFYTFGYYHFNLYYVLLSVVTVSSLLFYYNYKTSLNNNNIVIEEKSFNMPTKNYQESISYPEKNNNNEITTVYSSDSVNNQSLIDDSNIQKTDSKKTTSPFNNRDKDVNKSKSEQNVLNDNVLETFNESNDLNKSNSIESKKTIVVQESFDTIYKVDTQYVNKKSFFKKN